MNLVIVTSHKLYFHSLYKRFKCTANKHRELNFCHKFYLFIQFWECRAPPHNNVSKSNLWIGQSLFSILQSLIHSLNLSIWMLVAGAISISSLFSFWKLDYFSDMNCLTLLWRRRLSYRNQSTDCSANQWTAFYMTTAPVMKELNLHSCSSSTQLIFLCDIRVRYWSHRIYSPKIKSIPLGEIPAKAFPACAS